MTKHFSEADLLETYYTQPGESMPVMMHLARCAECSARYERLERKLRELSACHTEKPETFWTGQRMTIMRGISERRTPYLRIAAAALLAFVLGGLALYRSTEAPAPVVPKTATVEAQPINDLSMPSDPWQSDELKEFGAVVEWESWVTDTQKKGNHT